MKQKFIYLIMLVGLLTACNEEFTESPAVGALSDAALQNEAGVNLMLTGAYSTLDGVRANGFGNGWSISGDNWIMDVVSDDAHKGSTDGDQGDLYQVETFDWSTGNGYFYGKWGVTFAGINRANAVISLINGIEEGDFSAQLAEARFLRGHFNFELQKIWGNVPYISEENYNNSEFNQPNPGPIWDKIEADFEYAANNLPNTQGSEVGRPTSWAAKAFLAKAQLHQGKWSSALTIFNDVINNGPYDLLPDYVDNFRLAGDNSVESIFSIQFTADSGTAFNGNTGGALNFPNPGPFGACCGFYQPTQDLLNAYQTANGLPLLDTFNQTDVTSDYGINSSEAFTPYAGELDPRADYSIGRRGIDYNGYGVNPGKDWIRAEFADISGPYLSRKNVYWNGETDNMATGSWGQQHSGINYHIMRFADVLLMGAEAAAESGDIETALAYVNRVRNRAKNSNYVQAVDGSGDAANYSIEPYAGFSGQDEAVKAVRFERRLELAMEGQRLFDIRRWGNAPQIMNAYFANEARTIGNFGTKVNPYTATYDRFPIPVSAIDLSGNVLTQNPGF